MAALCHPLWICYMFKKDSVSGLQITSVIRLAGDVNVNKYVNLYLVLYYCGYSYVLFYNSVAGKQIKRVTLDITYLVYIFCVVIQAIYFYVLFCNSVAGEQISIYIFLCRTLDWVYSTTYLLFCNSVIFEQINIYIFCVVL